MMTYPIALVWADDDQPGPADELNTVARAIQRQVDEDFSRIWGCTAAINVEAYDPNGQPYGYPVLVKRDFSRDPDVEGYHFAYHSYPYAAVHYDDEWSITASHEILEMLVDPTGAQTRSGPHPTRPGVEPDVDYLLEVCDPCQHRQFAYDRGDGVRLSDFVVPDWYFAPAAGGRSFSFTGAVSAPRQVLPHGYVTFFERRSGRMQQWDGAGEPEEAVQPPTECRSFREWVDGRLDVPKPLDP